MKCPHCGLLSPESAQWCDCGYDFQTQTMGNERDPQTVQSSRAPNSAHVPALKGGANTIIAEGRFVKKRVQPMKKHGLYRGNGRLEVSEAGLTVVGKHVYSLGARWGLGLAIVFGCLILTAGAFAPGFLLIYPIVEYWWLKKEELQVPFSAITGIETSVPTELVAITFEGYPWCSPVVLKSTDFQAVADALRSGLASILIA
jgi:hypothetical protein